MCTAACAALAKFAADDPLRAALLGSPTERAAMGEAVMQLTRAPWDEAKNPCHLWLLVSTPETKWSTQQINVRARRLKSCRWPVRDAGHPRLQPGAGAGGRATRGRGERRRAGRASTECY